MKDVYVYKQRHSIMQYYSEICTYILVLGEFETYSEQNSNFIG